MSPIVSSPMTLGDKFAAANGRPSGFDYLRIALAISIICFHSVVTSYGQTFQHWFVYQTPARVWAFLLVPMFFALSGFLVAGSVQRSKTVVSFLGLRILRIVPALGVEVCLSALVLGSIFTTLPLDRYYASPGLHAYFLNIVGDVHFFLPGVFEHNPMSKVNGQLWTIPAELACYASLAVLALVGLVKRRGLLLAAFAVAQILFPLHAVLHGIPSGTIFGMTDWLLVLNFMAGLVMFLFRDRIVWRSDLALGAFILFVVLIWDPLGRYLIALPVAYLTACLGVLNPARLAILDSGDYSYGLYLYGSPLQQMVAAFGPVTQVWWINIALALPLSFGIAIASWHLVEKRALSLRKLLLMLETRFLSLHFRAAVGPGAPHGEDVRPPRGVALRAFLSWR